MGKHVAAAIEDALNRHGVLSRLVVNEAVVEAADDPKTEAGVACFPAGARPQFRVPAQGRQRLFRLDPESLRGAGIARGNVGEDAGQIVLSPAG